MPNKKHEMYSISSINALFEQRGGGCLSFTKEYRSILFRALSKLPREISEWAVEKLVFLSDMDKFSAYTVNIEDLLGKGKVGIVVLCSILKLQPEELQAFTIAHEVAHVKLKHATTFSDLSLMKKRELLDEKEADELAKAWLLQ